MLVNSKVDVMSPVRHLYTTTPLSPLSLHCPSVGVKGQGVSFNTLPQCGGE